MSFVRWIKHTLSKVLLQWSLAARLGIRMSISLLSSSLRTSLMTCKHGLLLTDMPWFMVSFFHSVHSNSSHVRGQYTLRQPLGPVASNQVSSAQPNGSNGVPQDNGESSLSSAWPDKQADKLIRDNKKLADELHAQKQYSQKAFETLKRTHAEYERRLRAQRLEWERLADNERPHLGEEVARQVSAAVDDVLTQQRYQFMEQVKRIAACEHCKLRQESVQKTSEAPKDAGANERVQRQGEAALHHLETMRRALAQQKTQLEQDFAREHHRANLAWEEEKRAAVQEAKSTAQMQYELRNQSILQVLREHSGQSQQQPAPALQYHESNIKGPSAPQLTSPRLYPIGHTAGKPNDSQLARFGTTGNDDSLVITDSMSKRKGRDQGHRTSLASPNSFPNARPSHHGADAAIRSEVAPLGSRKRNLFPVRGEASSAGKRARTGSTSSNFFFRNSTTLRQ